jgi:hypothetical protein
MTVLDKNIMGIPKHGAGSGTRTLYCNYGARDTEEVCHVQFSEI